jgi:hypothetical protein
LRDLWSHFEKWKTKQLDVFEKKFIWDQFQENEDVFFEIEPTCPLKIEESWKNNAVEAASLAEDSEEEDKPKGKKKKEVVVEENPRTSLNILPLALELLTEYSNLIAIVASNKLRCSCLGLSAEHGVYLVLLNNRLMSPQKHLMCWKKLEDTVKKG